MKYLKYILILILLVGLFSPMVKVDAQTPGDCHMKDGSTPKTTKDDCFANPNSQDWNGTITPSGLGDCHLKNGPTTKTTRAECFANPNSQDWNGTTTQNGLGDCHMKDGSTPKTTKDDCFANPNSQDWNGTITPSGLGDCHLKNGPTTRITKAECFANPNSQDWNGTTTHVVITPTTSPTTTTLLNKNYQLLTPLPCPPGNTTGCEDKNGKLVLTNFDTTGGIGNYLNLMITIFIGLCAVLSVVMIVVGGLEYMTSELSHSKEAGKERIMQAILGLLIALGAYALLYTINPDLLKSDVTIPNATTTSTPLYTGPDQNLGLPTGNEAIQS